MEQDSKINKKSRALAYMRVSTERQVDGASRETQERAIRKYAEDNGYEIADEDWYWEEGVSAKTANRPQLKQMLDDISSGRKKPEAVIVYNMSRLTRNMETFSADIAPPLRKAGVVIRSTMEAVGETPEGKLMLNISISFHQYDNDVKSATVKGNMKTVAGHGWNQSIPPLGFKTKKVRCGEKYHSILVPNDEMNCANLVAQLLNRFSEGDMSLMDAVRYAEKIGLRNRNGKPVELRNMIKILPHPAYAGFIQSEKLTGGKRVKANWDGIITEETHDRIIAILGRKKTADEPETRSYNKDDSRYPLKRSLVCPYCGRLIRGSAPTGGSGKPSPRYHCSECRGLHAVATEDVHITFLELLKHYTPKRKTLELFKIILCRTLDGVIAHTKAEIKEKEARIQEIIDLEPKILEKILKGEMNELAANTLLESHQKETAKLKLEIDDLRKNLGLSKNGIERIVALMEQPAEIWENAGLPTRQLLQQMIFPNGLCYDLVDKKFGTVVLSPLYSVIPTKNARNEANFDNLVEYRRFELLTSSMP